jgi:chromosome transmission fidelity protein 18
MEEEDAALASAPVMPQGVQKDLSEDYADVRDATRDKEDATMEEAQQGSDAADPAEERGIRACFSVPVEGGGSRSLRLLGPRKRERLRMESGQLLTQPIAVLRDAIDAQKAEDAVAQEAAEAALQSKRAALAAQKEETGEDDGLRHEAAASAPVQEKEEPDQANARKQSAALWVDKYAPRTFMDLVSDERVNRRVLRWVKEWDPFVFGGARGAKSAAPPVAGRPERPLMLISGPPGLGKTTLAHIVARHAGYRPAEINASDERSAKVLKQRVADATEVQSVYGDRRPPLIVIDEIDGAMGGPEGAGAINELIRLANATTANHKPSEAHQDDPSAAAPKRGGGARQKSGRKPSEGLMRPVICICNDLYAPALRPLRQVAEMVEFRPASNMQLVARLRAVCQSERIHTDLHTLNALCHQSDQDVRTCLNTLQFVKAKSNDLTEQSLANSGVSRKVVGKSPLQLWKQIFTSAPRKHRGAAAKGRPAPRTYKGTSSVTAARSAGSGVTSPDSVATSSYDQILQDLELADVPRVVDGVVENYLGVSYTDPSLTRTSAAAETLSCLDVMTEAQYSKGHFALQGYAKTSVAAVHTLCAVPALRDQLVFPRTERDARARRASRQGILRSWQAGLQPSLSHFYQPSTLLVDVLTPLLTILTPPIKPAAMQLLASEERQTLFELVNHMIAFGLRYTQMAEEGGAYVYRLDPPLTDLLPPLPSADAESESDGKSDGRELPAAVRGLLSTEVQRELMRRHHAATADGAHASSAASPSTIASSTPAKKPPAIKPVPKKLEPKAIAEETTRIVEKRDMFGRVIQQGARGTKRSLGACIGEGGSGVDAPLPYRFRYHEGVTDAVRRPVKVRDLL